MSKMYNNQCSPEERVKPSYFRMIFNTKYNLSFTTPRTDVCSTCIELAEKIKRCTDEEEKNNFIIEKNVHKRRANAFFQLLKETRNDLITLSFDCQKNLVLPKVPDQTAYYSRQLYLYNFTIVQGTSQSKLNEKNVFSYFWTENEFGKGSNEITSCVFDRLNKIEFGPTVTVVRLMADGCSGQNKNTTLIGMCCKWLSEKSPENIQNIEVIFPVVGHSFLPADRGFGNIEKEIRKLEVITQPETYIELLSKNGTAVHLGENCNVFDWKESISDVVRPTGTWHFSFKNTKRFLLKKCKTGNVLIRGTEASETAPRVETALGGRLAQSLAEQGEASGTTPRTGTTRPRTSSRITQGNSLEPAVTGLESELSDPAQTLRRGRQRWTRDMNLSLISAYFQVTEGEKNTKKYAAKLAEKWLELYPDKEFSGKHLIAQIKNIKSRKLLSPDELESMRVESQTQSPTSRMRNIRRSIREMTTAPRHSLLRQEEVENNTQQVTELEQDESATEIKALFEETNLKWIGIPMKCRPYISRIKLNPEAKSTIRAIDTALRSTLQESEELEELCHKVHCAAIVANLILETTAKQAKNIKEPSNKPPWEERLEKRITTLRKEIGIYHLYLNKDNLSRKVRKKMRAYAGRINLKESDTGFKMKIRKHAEKLQQKIAALGNRLRRYHKRSMRYQQNNLFQNNQKVFFRSVDGQKRIENQKPPCAEEMRQYWSSIWSQERKHKAHAPWIEAERENSQSLPEMPTVNVTEVDVRDTIKRMKNWAAPGIDGIHSYWWKALTSTHKVLARLIGGALKNPQKIPHYFTEGKTYLLPKKEDLDHPENYRPITCLSSIYKIITSLLANKINTHLKHCNVMAWEQNGCRSKSRGSKELLVIDNELTKLARRRNKNIAIAWIDYQKAYDTVPHSWLIEVLVIYKIERRVIEVLKTLMATWRTTLSLCEGGISYETSEIQIKRGIFQGDGLSPPWFCLALNALSGMLNRSAYGYAVDERTKITHLFYMDDLKLYARGRAQLEGELEMVRMFSADIGMNLGLEKCATIIVRRGKLSEEENVRLKDGKEINNLTNEDKYKYLGIQQTFEIRHKENKDHTKEELLRRIRLILKSQLSAKNKIMAINIWAIPPLTYTAGVLSWSKTELQQIDQKIRTTLTQFGLHHPNSAIERLYLPRKEGGRGLCSVEATCGKEMHNIRNHFLNSHLPIHRWIAQGTRSMILQPDEDHLEMLRQRWSAKELHGRFYSNIHQEEVDITASNTYLIQGYMFPQTEGTIFAIQDQVVPTRNYIKHIIKKQIENTKCRLCNKAEETVLHLTSGCSSIAGTKYLSRHDNMGKVVHQLIAQREELIRQFTPHHIYMPASILENERTKIYWDFNITTDIGTEHNRPDMVVWNKKEMRATIIDFAVPQDGNLVKTYTEKISKYSLLAWQMRDMWQLRKVDIIPLIISVNGIVPRKTVQHLQELGLPPNTVTWMQKAVLLGTVNIIRQVLFPH
ncbi:uncharacterized protein LOC123322386 [Coccinella septempunctata]|uniref:uncharacterized protein LOC123322386 n=1 Tax=Coccinella septempunctata TaxID=41139 RepID=UPI001D06C55B|nr:uncharacterized protein LOC123322386 [Coccinella septempunctata]